MKQLFKNKSLLIIACLGPLILLGFFFILSENQRTTAFRPWESIFGPSKNNLLFLLFALCPLSHFLMMRGHNKHGH